MISKTFSKPSSKKLLKYPFSSTTGAFKIPKPVLPQFGEVQLDHEVECKHNLSLSYPDLPVAETIKEGLIFAAENNLNQYTRYQGHPPLVENISRLLSSKFETRASGIDAMNEIIVGTGATGTISGIIWPFFKKGDGVLALSSIESKTKMQLE